MLIFCLYLFEQLAIFKCARTDSWFHSSTLVPSYRFITKIVPRLGSAYAVLKKGATLGSTQARCYIFRKHRRCYFFSTFAQVLKTQVHTPVLPKVAPLKSSTLGSTFKKQYLRQYLDKVQHFQKTSKVLLFQYIAQVLKPQVHTPVLPKVVPLKSSTLGNTLAPPVVEKPLRASVNKRCNAV